MNKTICLTIDYE